MNRVKMYQKKVSDIIRNSYLSGAECNNSCTDKFMGYCCEHKDTCSLGRINHSLQKLSEKIEAIKY